MGFDQRFYLILNLAIGGTLGGHVSFSSDQVMEVDYAHVYCLDGSVSCKTPPYSCCNECGSKSYCSPHSGNCYDSKNKDHYLSCLAPMPSPIQSELPAADTSLTPASLPALV